MTWDERVAKVRLHGFTDRQSAFLVTVMLHAGVCLGRHYCTFAGLAYGRKMHDFFQALLARGLRDGARVRPPQGAPVSHPLQTAVSRHWRAEQSSSATDGAAAGRLNG